MILITNVLEEMPCRCEPPCGWEHWRATGERRLTFEIGPLWLPLPSPRFLVDFVERRRQAAWKKHEAV